MTKAPRVLNLDYFREYKLGNLSGANRRNVSLRPGKVAHLPERVHFFDHDTFSWHLAKRLEGREDVSSSEGIWPINCWRCERRYGLPGSDLFPREYSLKDATPAIYGVALEMRRLCYFRVANAEEARNAIAIGHPVRYACEITSQWYDPPGGTIEASNEQYAIAGSHAVPLIEFSNLNGGYFKFPNSWGQEWGQNGFGAISVDYFQRHLIEGWVGFGCGVFIPYESDEGIVCLEWKWSLSDAVGVHGREIVDARTGDRIAWAFCVRREHFLDIEEFFVWPTERRKGYGRVLARMILELAASMKVPLRTLVSYADTEPENKSNLDAATRLLGVALQECESRWTHLVGTSSIREFTQPTRPRPKRPAFMLELLRPKDEKPIDEPIRYSVFFGTNRTPSKPGGDNTNNVFTAERSGKLYTGISTVTIPKTHRFGSKGSAWLRLWTRIFKNNPRVFSNELFGDIEGLSTRLSKLRDEFDGKMHNLLYVHGFNVTFDAAIQQAAYLGVDLKIPGATFVFSWPSAGRIGSYMADEAAIDACLPYMSEFIHGILKSTADEPLSIIVHSMGNRAVLRFLETVSQEEMRGRIQNVIFAAPDVDLEAFNKMATKALTISSRATLYAARADIPLLSSGWLHDYPRAGLAPPVAAIPGMDTILVERFNLLNLGHGYYAESASVLHDIFVMLHYNAEPEGRPALTRTETESGELYWKLALS